jgi:hypothetical protein
MAMQVVAKNVKKAEATDSNRLVNSPKPSSGKPRTLPPPGRCVPINSVISMALVV